MYSDQFPNKSWAPEPILHELCERVGKSNLERLAKNPATPLILLEAMAIDADPQLRAWVAANPATPNRIIEILVLDESVEVRQTIAGIPQMERPVLRRLIKDQNPYVAASALKTLEFLLRKDATRLKNEVTILLDNSNKWRGL